MTESGLLLELGRLAEEQANVYVSQAKFGTNHSGVKVDTKYDKMIGLLLIVSRKKGPMSFSVQYML